MNAPRQLTLDLVQPPQPSFGNFVVGRNAEAVAALRALAFGEAAGPVYLWGEVGCGRSHLLAAVANAAGVQSAVGRQRALPTFNAALTGYLVDDVDQLDADDQQRLFTLINEVRAQRGAWLVAAGAAPPAQLPLRADVTTRLAWGLVYQLHALSDDEKAHALRAHAHSRGAALASEVIAYLLTHMPRDMRTLVAIVDAVDDYALSLQRPITVPLLREWARHGTPGSAA